MQPGVCGSSNILCHSATAYPTIPVSPLPVFITHSIYFILAMICTSFILKYYFYFILFIIFFTPQVSQLSLLSTTYQLAQFFLQEQALKTNKQTKTDAYGLNSA